MFVAFTQGGIFPGSQGARLQRNLQTHMKCWQKFTRYHKHIFSSARNVLPQEEISCHSKKFLATRRFFSKRKKFLVTGRNFLSQEKILVTGRNFLPKQEISCPRSLGEILCHNKSFFMLISIYFQKKFPVQDEIFFTGRNFI